ncbi:NUDIX domain-containing protein [Streptococcus parasuis]|uniref:NUDIX domain-containing protein n=1 Tax=Streptococcus parasuis TaxID=1501662 RepID=UPI0037D9D3DF
MSRTEQVILTNMCMITDGRRILVQDKKSEKWPGVTFPGGHVECGESIISSVIHEIKEEMGLTVSNLEICGIQNWTDPTDHYRYLKFLRNKKTRKNTHENRRQKRYSCRP